MHRIRFSYPLRTFSRLSLASMLALSANGCADDKDSDSTGGDTESESTLTGGTDS